MLSTKCFIVSRTSSAYGSADTVPALHLLHERTLAESTSDHRQMDLTHDSPTPGASGGGTQARGWTPPPRRNRWCQWLRWKPGQLSPHGRRGGPLRRDGHRSVPAAAVRGRDDRRGRGRAGRARRPPRRGRPRPPAPGPSSAVPVPTPAAPIPAPSVPVLTPAV